MINDPKEALERILAGDIDLHLRSTMVEDNEEVQKAILARAFSDTGVLAELDGGLTIEDLNDHEIDLFIDFSTGTSTWYASFSYESGSGELNDDGYPISRIGIHITEYSEAVVFQIHESQEIYDLITGKKKIYVTPGPSPWWEHRTFKEILCP